MLSSCGFSPFKTAFAADIIVPDYTGSAVSLGYFYDQGYATSWDPISHSGTVNIQLPFASGYSPYLYKLNGFASDIFSISFAFNNSFYFNSSYDYLVYGGLQYRTEYPPAQAVIPYSVYLEYVMVSPTDDYYYGYWECDLVDLGNGQLYWEYVFDDEIPSDSSIGIERLWVCYGEPSSTSLQYPSDWDYSGLVNDNPMLCLTNTYYRTMSRSTSDDKFQSDVVGGLDDINNDINKGFDSIQGEISSGTDEVVDAVDGVKNSVDDLNSTAQEWGQNIVNGITEGATAIQETITEESEKLGNFILDGLKSLFIPRDGYFKELFDDLNSFFSEVFGFLYFPIEHALSWFNRLLNLPEVAPSIAIPELAYEGEVLIPAQTYTFDFLQDEPFSTVHGYYLMAIDAAMIMSFVHLLQRKYEEVMRN